MTTTELNKKSIVYIMQQTGVDEIMAKTTLKKFANNEKFAIEYLADAGILGRILQYRRPWLASLLFIIPIAIGGELLGWLALLNIFKHNRLNLLTNLMLIIGSPLILWWMKEEYDHYNFLFWSRGEKL